MAFDVSALSSYTTPANELTAKAINPGAIAKYSTVFPGIKSSQYINPNYSTVVFNSSTSCGFTPSGTTTVGQVSLSVDPISLQERFCVKDFDTKSLQNMLAAGSSGNDVQVVQKFMDEKVQAMQFEVAKMAWQGNKLTGSNNLARTNGWLNYLLHTSYSGSVVSSAITVHSGNILTTVDWVINNIPAAILMRQDLFLIMTTANYRLYINALRDSGNFHFTGEAGSEWTTKVPGYPVTVVSEVGLDSNADGVDMVLSSAANLVRGTDMLNEEERFELWWSQDNREIRFDSSFKIGYNIVFPEHVVIVK